MQITPNISNKHPPCNGVVIEYGHLKKQVLEVFWILKFFPGAYWMWALKRCWALIWNFTVCVCYRPLDIWSHRQVFTYKTIEITYRIHASGLKIDLIASASSKLRFRWAFLTELFRATKRCSRRSYFRSAVDILHK